MTKAWEEIINTSIIGTDKKQVNKQLLPADLNTVLEQAEQSITEREEQFLRAAAVIYNYRRGGFLAGDAKIPSVEACTEETQIYCSLQARAALQAVLGDDNVSLLYYWLLKCNKVNQIISPEFVPTLLEWADKHKDLKQLIMSALGQRGRWMSLFNPRWHFKTGVSYKEVFDHGKADERKQALSDWRNDNPTEAREALAAAWLQEPAASKAELLSVLETNLSLDDEALLAAALKEKSQKVKDATLQLLKQMPGSFILKEAWEFVKPLISVKRSGGLLGLLSKETIELNLSFDIPEHFKGYGISHIDANKIYSEKEFTLSQLIGMVPPTVWEEYFDLKPAKILELFDKKEETKKFISSIAVAANTFKNAEWGIVLYKSYNMLCYAVIRDFDRETQEEAALHSINDAKHIYTFLPGKEQEWSHKFAMALLEKTAQEPYAYPKAFYKNIIHHFPVSVIEKLEKISITDPLRTSYWDTISADIKKMLAIKQQIIQSF